MRIVRNALCDECGEKVAFVVRVGAAFAAELCRPCLHKAVGLAVQTAQSLPDPLSAPEADEQAGSEGKDLRGPF